MLCGTFPGLSQQRSIPDWGRGVTWYRILIDRFCNGDSANDATAQEIFADKKVPWELTPWTGNWYKLSTKESLFNSGFYTNALLRQYGGDLPLLTEWRHVYRQWVHEISVEAWHPGGCGVIF